MVWGINSYVHCGQVFTSCGFYRSFSTLNQIIIGRPAARFAIVFLWEALAFGCVCVWLNVCMCLSVYLPACVHGCISVYFSVYLSVCFSHSGYLCFDFHYVYVNLHCSFFSFLIFLILFLHPMSDCFNLFRSLSLFLSTSPH